MKSRNGFISNSSSSSFICCTPRNLIMTAINDAILDPEIWDDVSVENCDMVIPQSLKIKIKEWLENTIISKKFLTFDIGVFKYDCLNIYCGEWSIAANDCPDELSQAMVEINESAYPASILSMVGYRVVQELQKIPETDRIIEEQDY
jgi:hypothetical protein